MKRYFRDNSLTLFFLVSFLATLAGQAYAGHADFNNQLVADGLAPIGLGRYVTSSQYAVDVVENWQSEYLQFLLFTIATVWLVQRGSPESSAPDKIGHESDKQQIRLPGPRSAGCACSSSPGHSPSSWGPSSS